MGISRITAAEIFTNPYDLEIFIRQTSQAGGGKFAFFISRGPGHGYKPMINSKAFADTLEDAVKEVQSTLSFIHQKMTANFADSKSFPSLHINPDNEEIDPATVLGVELIAWIADELRKPGHMASTYKKTALLTTTG